MEHVDTMKDVQRTSINHFLINLPSTGESVMVEIDARCAHLVRGHDDHPLCAARVLQNPFAGSSFVFGPQHELCAIQTRQRNEYMRRTSRSSRAFKMPIAAGPRSRTTRTFFLQM
jgi:hypothetical protein